MISIVQPLGIALDCCPWAFLSSPDVQTCYSLKGWRETGSIGPDDLDLETRRMVEAFCRGIAAHESEHFERLRKDRESKVKK